jgi:hypothetical protein
MHEQDFSNSFQPPTTKIFGVRLETFAIGHELALIRQGNPLATYTESSFAELSDDAKKLALALAVEICGKLGFLGKWKFVIAEFRTKPEELEAEIKRFRDYRATGSRDLPLTKMPKQHGIPFRYFGAPGLASLLNYVTAHHSLLIQSHFKGSPLNFPLGLAQILYTTHLETTGAVWVKNHQEMEREKPPREGTPPPGQNERIYTGAEAEKVFAEAAKKAAEGTN